jgi:hypothetical protein
MGFAALYPSYGTVALQIASIALAKFAGLPCSRSFFSAALGVFMQMH